MDFKKITLDDFGILREALARYRGRICDISPGNLVFWRDYYDISYAKGDSGLILRFGDMDGMTCYWCESERAVRALLAHTGEAVSLTCLCEDEVARLSQSFCVRDVWHDRDWDDYLYSAEELIALRGKRFHAKKNHVNRFRKSYPDARFEPLTAEHAEAVRAFLYDYFHTFGKEDAEVAAHEEQQLCEQLMHWDAYGQCGGVLWVGDRIVGVSIGEVVGETLIVHTEKADTAFDGAYPMLMQSFAAAYGAECRYINREEDCGVEGLRASKLSYQPIEIRKKYCLVISDAGAETREE